ncbi:MAG: ATP-grasp domain-containing protein [Jatrophihabitantaceae bacterium]
MTYLAFVESNITGHGVRALRTAKELGYRVAFLTSSPNLYRPPGGPDPLEPVDELVIADTYHPGHLNAALSLLPRPVDGIVAFDDYHLTPASAVARLRGLPAPSEAGLRTCRQKDLTRAALADAAAVPHQVVDADDEDVPKRSPVGYPCVVKPVDDSGSVAVRRCDDDVEFQAALAAVLERTVNVRGYRLTRRAIVERYLDGAEYSVEALSDGSGWQILGVTTKVLGRQPYAVELAHAFPAPLPEELTARLQSVAAGWLDAVGLDWGAAHIELRLTEAGPLPIEINPRLGGGRIMDLIRLSTGCDPVEQFLRLSVGESLPAPHPALRNCQAAAIRFLTADQHGNLESVQGVAAARGREGVQEVCMVADLPRRVRPATSGYDYLGHVIAVGASPVIAQARADAAADSIAMKVTAL